jgi:Uma2 family endonuclease
MTTKPKLLTPDDLLELYSKGIRGELIQGVLCEIMPAGGQHGEIAAILISMLMNIVRPRKLGKVTGTDAGVLLEPNFVREPDIAFFSVEKLPLDVIVTGYYEVIPDLVVEIASPGDTNVESHDKARMWLSFGVPMVWEVLPGWRSVNVHRLNRPIVVLNEDDTLDGGDVLPGFSCPVREIFDL